MAIHPADQIQVLLNDSLRAKIRSGEFVVVAHIMAAHEVSPREIHHEGTRYIPATPLTDLIPEMTALLLRLDDEDDLGTDWDLWHLARRIRAAIHGAPTDAVQ